MGSGNHGEEIDPCVTVQFYGYLTIGTMIQVLINNNCNVNVNDFFVFQS